MFSYMALIALLPAVQVVLAWFSFGLLAVRADAPELAHFRVGAKPVVLTLRPQQLTRALRDHEAIT
jgi:hypothetical protein